MVGGGVVVAPSYQEDSDEPKPEKLDFYSLKLCFSWVQGERGREREEHGWTLCDVTAREPRSQDIESRGEPRQQRVIERAGPAPKRKPRAPSASGSVGATPPGTFLRGGTSAPSDGPVRSRSEVRFVQVAPACHHNVRTLKACGYGSGDAGPDAYARAAHDGLQTATRRAGEEDRGSTS